MRINIDITEKMEAIIRDEVKVQLERGGLLRFVRDCINNKINHLGIPTTIKRHENQIHAIEKKLSITDNEK